MDRVPPRPPFWKAVGQAKLPFALPQASSGDRADRLTQFFAVTLCLLCAAAIWITWGRWGDIQMDFGRELYLPWQLSQGRVLYRDVATFNGPFSPYLNAALFRLVSPSLNTLIAANIAILGATCLCLYKLISAVILRPMSAFAALGVLGFYLIAFATNAAIKDNNYNSLAPYSHEATHGLLLLIGGCLLLVSFSRAVSRGKALAIGAIIGCCFLTKPEIALASLGLLFGAVMGIWQSSHCRHAKLAIVAFLLAGALAPPLAAWMALSVPLSPGKAFYHLSFMWRMAAMPEIISLQFYKEISGLATPWRSLLLLVQAAIEHIALAGYLAGLALIGSMLDRRSRVLSIGAPLAILLATYALLPAAWKINLLQLFLFWPLFLLILILILARRMWKTDVHTRRSAIPALALCLVALALTSKVLLNAIPVHYGSLLLAPAGAIWCATLVGVLPLTFSEPAKRRTAAICALAFCWILPWPLIKSSAFYLQNRASQVVSPRGTMIVDQRGEAISAALRLLRQKARPQDTLAVLPEGAMLNFFSGLPNPTPYIALLPPEWIAFGGKKITDAYLAAPPDWVILMRRSTKEYAQAFCQTYAQSLCRSLENNYAQEALFRATPLRDRQFFLFVLRRNAAYRASSPRQ